MNKFLIFGDSYADQHVPPYPSSDENDNWQKTHSYRWTIRIKEKFEKEYSFKNHAKSGSSPYNALSKLKDYEKYLEKNDIILFFLSDFDRIDFIAPYEIRSHLSNIFYSTQTNKCELFEDSKFDNHRKLKAFYMLKESELTFFYNNLFNILPHELLEQLVLSYLKTLSGEKKCRVILFRKNFVNPSINYRLKNTEYYYEFDEILSKVTDDEWQDFNSALQNQQDYMIVDKRVNHFSPENHEIMFDSICKILDYDYDNILNFKTKIINENLKDNIVYRGSNDRKFIYE